jgi:hypothetical protein
MLEQAQSPASAGALEVAVHQPGYHRHLYYFAKMLCADAFVSLDTVQFVNREWQNRQQFWWDGRRRWLTVPVNSGREPIYSKRIVDDAAVHNHWRILSQAYSGTPYFSLYRDDVANLYGERWASLVELNMALVELARRFLGIETPILRARDLPATTGVRGALLAELSLAAARSTSPAPLKVTYLACAEPMRADHYLRRSVTERDTRTELDAIQERGVSVGTFPYRHPVYPQHQLPPGVPFERDLSVYDLLFNTGPDAADILRRAVAVTDG